MRSPCVSSGTSSTSSPGCACAQQRRDMLGLPERQLALASGDAQPRRHIGLGLRRETAWTSAGRWPICPHRRIPRAISCAYCARVDSTTGNTPPCCAAISRQMRKSLACRRTRNPAGKLLCAMKGARLTKYQLEPAPLPNTSITRSRRQAFRVRKRHGFADRLDDAGAHDLIGGLRRLAGAARAHVGDGLAHFFQDRLRAVEYRLHRRRTMMASDAVRAPSTPPLTGTVEKADAQARRAARKDRAPFPLPPWSNPSRSCWGSIPVPSPRPLRANPRRRTRRSPRLRNSPQARPSWRRRGPSVPRRSAAAFSAVRFQTPVSSPAR